MRIGRLAEATGVSTTTLRFYEVSGLLPEPARTASGYRDYSPKAAARVAFIKRAQAAGLTLRHIRQVLAVRDDGHAPCSHVAEVVDERLEDVERRLSELDAVRTELLALRSRLGRLDPADCPDDEICVAFAYDAPASDHDEDRHTAP